jgi:deazaflavin-dependent oxidoreductase (nitroreductase family)
MLRKTYHPSGRLARSATCSGVIRRKPIRSAATEGRRSHCATDCVMAVCSDRRNVGIVPSDFQLKTMNLVHRTVLKLTGGKIGWTAGGMPALQLTTLGRKTGELRTVMLTSPIQEGETIVIVASRGGDPQHPAWFLNLQANPEVTVSLQGKPSRPMRARVATAEERAIMWPRVTASYKGYAGYQTKTTREIPLVLLEPIN